MLDTRYIFRENALAEFESRRRMEFSGWTARQAARVELPTTAPELRAQIRAQRNAQLATSPLHPTIEEV